MAHELDGAKAKLARGRHHIDSLERLALEAISSDIQAPFTVRKQLNNKQTEISLLVAQVRDAPQSFSVVIGDALHNFRSALDHVAWQLARKSQGRIPRSRVAFPIVRTPEEFREERIARMLREIDSCHQLIIEQLQPYRQVFASDYLDPLTSLRALSNKDKHRLLHVIPTVNIKLSMMYTGTTDCEVVQMGINNDAELRPPKPGLEVARFWIRRTGPNPDVKIKLTGSSYFAFAPDESGFIGVDIFNRLRSIGHRADDVIRCFEPVFCV